MHETRSTIAVQNLSVQPRIVVTVAIIGAGTMGVPAWRWTIRSRNFRY